MIKTLLTIALMMFMNVNFTDAVRVDAKLTAQMEACAAMYKISGDSFGVELHEKAHTLAWSYYKEPIKLYERSVFTDTYGITLDENIERLDLQEFCDTSFK
ncbi:hypothetical protein HWQ46_24470 [Shewanella sp. D64]|uniref:hypothetical protein n=1 Tax=unclassified Shewanella TaxID=196818 RepID=UPI0022BA4FD1|nr:MULTISPECIES: hypothetical protein [unclassified Shewanella]MEC4728681.1 hypothetical protein [Shewanella sp. D64]MEC4736538.1 hypothetical protein [Shewanella sp. E94]WBJ97410.1 hypothetical protein HWQ47_10165 [Shewanella sp. MTB7]